MANTKGGNLYLGVEDEGKLLGAIENLIEDGLVEGVGSGKSRSYILSVKVYKENNRSIQYVRQTGIIH